MINIHNKKLVIIIASFLMIFGLVSVIYVLISNQSSKNDPTKDPSYTLTYVDPGSGETVITTPNKTPENMGGFNITMLGFSKLTSDYGMTFDQVKDLQSDFSDYSKSQKTPISEISITLNSITTTIDQNTGDVIDNFIVTINRSSTLKARVTYFGIDNPTLKLYNSKTNSLLFTSK